MARKKKTETPESLDEAAVDQGVASADPPAPASFAFESQQPAAFPAEDEDQPAAATGNEPEPDSVPAEPPQASPEPTEPVPTPVAEDAVPAAVTDEPAPASAPEQPAPSTPEADQPAYPVENVPDDYERRPELYVGGAFAGGFLLAKLRGRFGRG